MESKESFVKVTCKSRITAKCDGCPALKLQSQVSTCPAVPEVLVELCCENEAVCNALEDRRWDSFMPCFPGDDLYFTGGKMGRVTGVLFDDQEYPLICCLKFYGDDCRDFYDFSFRANELGKLVFLLRDNVEEEATGCDEGNAAQPVLMPAHGKRA